MLETIGKILVIGEAAPKKIPISLLQAETPLDCPLEKSLEYLSTVGVRAITCKTRVRVALARTRLLVSSYTSMIYISHSESFGTDSGKVAERLWRTAQAFKFTSVQLARIRVEKSSWVRIPPFSSSCFVSLTFCTREKPKPSTTCNT